MFFRDINDEQKMRDSEIVLERHPANQKVTENIIHEIGAEVL